MSKKLIDAMADLNEDVVLEEVETLKVLNAPTLDIIAMLQEGMGIVGKRFEEHEYFLSELIMSAEIFKSATGLLEGTGAEAPSKYGSFVIGTIYGDVHDIGKNIVAMVMSSNGFNVVDLGVDVPTEKFIEAIKSHKPKVIGISCLLTTAFSSIRECIAALEKEGLRKDIIVLIGGGPVDENTRKYVGADHVCKNAQQTVELCKKYMA